MSMTESHLPVSRIVQLAPEVANQIAAGEVIERPASVVKELLENAWDAGSDAIVIELSSGGMSRIRVIDNGRGIVPDDLILAVSAHATSKLRTLSDLAGLTSMGFRGEALASIASVSRLQITSRTVDALHATTLVCEGHGTQLLKSARTPGTTVEVCDLFHNAPVRKKFLKSERAEFDAIDALVRRFALAAPHIAITLRHNGKTLLDFSRETGLHARMQKIFGKAFADANIAVDAEATPMRLSGWVSGAGFQRSQNDRQWFFVNQRMVRDKLLLHALRQAFEQRLHPGTHAACLLYLELPPELVDVNVHPTKHELRFSEPRLVHDFLVSTIRHALAKDEKRLPSTLQKAGRVTVSPAREPARLTPKTDTESFRWVALNARFCVVFAGVDVWWVDVQALVADWTNNLLESASYPLVSRPLLVPMRLSVPLSEAQVMQQAAARFTHFGLSLDQAGAQQWLVRSLPVILPHLDVGQLLQSFTPQKVHDEAAMRRWLCACTDVDARQVSDSLRQDLLAHLLHSEVSRPAFSKLLTLEACEGVLHA